MLHMPPGQKLWDEDELENNKLIHGGITQIPSLAHWLYLGVKLKRVGLPFISSAHFETLHHLIF